MHVGYCEERPANINLAFSCILREFGLKLAMIAKSLCFLLGDPHSTNEYSPLQIMSLVKHRSN